MNSQIGLALGGGENLVPKIVGGGLAAPARVPVLTVVEIDRGSPNGLRDHLYAPKDCRQDQSRIPKNHN